jgi:hypothetical protein
MSRVVVFAPNLMDRSKIAAAVPDRDVSFVSAAGALSDAAADAEVVVIDLSRFGALERLSALPEGVRSIGFGSHVDTELLRHASAVGCDTVLPRSKFFAEVDSLLA